MKKNPRPVFRSLYSYGERMGLGGTGYLLFRDNGHVQPDALTGQIINSFARNSVIRASIGDHRILGHRILLHHVGEDRAVESITHTIISNCGIVVDRIERLVVPSNKVPRPVFRSLYSYGERMGLGGTGYLLFRDNGHVQPDALTGQIINSFARNSVIRASIGDHRILGHRILLHHVGEDRAVESITHTIISNCGIVVDRIERLVVPSNKVPRPVFLVPYHGERMGGHREVGMANAVIEETVLKE